MKEPNYAKQRLEDEPAPGMLPNGKLNVVKPGDPKFEPRVIDDEGPSASGNAKGKVGVETRKTR